MTKQLFIKIVGFILYIGWTSAFSQSHQGYPYRSLPDHFNTPTCHALTLSFMAEDGKIKTRAHHSLPVNLYLHESIPENYRPFFYIAAQHWNRSVKSEFIKISSEIDRGVIDVQANISDQRNVIYLVDRSTFNSMAQLNFSSGATRPILSRDKALYDTLPYIPIIDVDILIQKDALTDLEYYRAQLIKRLKSLGVEKDFSDTDVETLQRRVADRIENMTSEDVKTFLIEAIKRTALLNQYTNTFTTQDDIDERIAQIQNLDIRRINQNKAMLRYDLLTVNLALMNSQSSVALQNIIKHEMGHVLGLGDLIFEPSRTAPLMKPNLLQFGHNSITVPQ